MNQSLLKMVWKKFYHLEFWNKHRPNLQLFHQQNRKENSLNNKFAQFSIRKNKSACNLKILKCLGVPQTLIFESLLKCAFDCNKLMFSQYFFIFCVFYLLGRNAQSFAMEMQMVPSWFAQWKNVFGTQT